MDLDFKLFRFTDIIIFFEKRNIITILNSGSKNLENIATTKITVRPGLEIVYG